jgi:hypothetical protein
MFARQSFFAEADNEVSHEESPFANMKNPFALNSATPNSFVRHSNEGTMAQTPISQFKPLQQPE